jgi:colicin import membrane protein
MSPSLWAALDGLMQEQYKQCWSYLGMGSTGRYIPQIQVEYHKDGSLAIQPVLKNPPSDPSLTSLAESALRAVRRCNPLKIPAQYQPYFEQWRARILRFDPEEMQG